MLFKIVAGFFLILGVFFFIQGLINVIHIQKSLSWPSVEGVIVKSELASESLSRSGDIGTANYSASPSSIDKAVIEYHFERDGEVFAGDRVAIGDYISSTRTEDILKKYPVGAKVRVYYNKGEVTLETRQSIANFISVGVGALLLTLAFAFYRWGIVLDQSS
jgi:VIT1/CCC1 family predicted Fe2+/Mn2+ transporter